MTLQDPIEISSDDEVEAEGPKEEVQADGQPVRRTTRSNAHMSTGSKFKVRPYRNPSSSRIEGGRPLISSEDYAMPYCLYCSRVGVRYNTCIWNLVRDSCPLLSEVLRASGPAPAMRIAVDFLQQPSDICWWSESLLLNFSLQGLKALYPPGGGPDSVQVVASDLARLDPDEFLNYTIIDFFIKCIFHLFLQPLEFLSERVGLCHRPCNL